MSVRRPVDLLVHLHHAVDHRLPLLFREVQRLVDGIGEEGVVLHAAAQRGAVQQFGMEHQAPSRAFEGRAVGLGAEDLPRRDEDQRVLLEVVRAAAVFEIVRAFQLFQENQVHPDMLAGVGDRMRDPASFDHVDQRVPRRDAHVVVVLLDRFQLQGLVHGKTFYGNTLCKNNEKIRIGRSICKNYTRNRNPCPAGHSRSR